MRVVTRGDLDGLTGSVIVALHEQVDQITLIHPQDITAGKIEITGDDILINVPYHPACAKWFDHHLHTATYETPPEGFDGAFAQSPSAARLVYDYYGGAAAMPALEELVHQTDRLDSANLRPGDVLVPRDFIKLGFTLDSRTGIGAFKDYFETLHQLLVEQTPVQQILEHPEVKRRCDLIATNDRAYRETLREHSETDENVVITDLRGLERPPIGNRFLIYAIFPTTNVSIRLHWGPRQSFVVAALGHSIFNRTCRSDVGALAASYGGGGHKGAASIPLQPATADERIREILDQLKSNG